MDRQRLVLRAASLPGRPDDPGVGLRIQIVHIREAAAGEERIADKTNGPFYACLLYTSRCV